MKGLGKGDSDGAYFGPHEDSLGQGGQPCGPHESNVIRKEVWVYCEEEDINSKIDNL